MLRILCVGDVVGTVGVSHLTRVLPAFKRAEGIDVCVVNGENAADGNGLTVTAAHRIMEAGADVITGGNHTFRRNEVFDLLDTAPWLVRPANMTGGLPGRGCAVVDRGRYCVTVINLVGQVYMNAADSPFDAFDREWAAAGKPRLCVVDFHAEATAEKKAMACYADGRVSALFGTHTHVQTADEQILPGGTGFITDVGMTGPTQSVLGVCCEQSVLRMRTGLPTRFTVADGPCVADGVVFEVDEKSGRTLAVRRVKLA